MSARAGFWFNRRSLATGMLSLAGSACASAPQHPAIAPQDERCTAISDSLSKYISADALPLARLDGNARALPVPRIQPGDSVEVDFVVLPNGTADTSTVAIIGADDPQFARSAVQFASQSRFSPGQTAGCNVVSHYNLVLKPGQGR